MRLPLLAGRHDVKRRESRAERAPHALAVKRLDPASTTSSIGPVTGSNPAEAVGCSFPDVDAGGSQDHAVEIARVSVGDRLVDRRALLEQRPELLGVAVRAGGRRVRPAPTPAPAWSPGEP